MPMRAAASSLSGTHPKLLAGFDPTIFPYAYLIMIRWEERDTLGPYVCRVAAHLRSPERVILDHVREGDVLHRE